MEGFNRDLIRRVAGTREGTSIMMAMMTEMSANQEENTQDKLEALMDLNLTGMSDAEDKAESKHFIQGRINTLF